VAKQLILDANILMRAVLGTRVVALIRDYAPTVDFLTVDEAFEDVSTYLPQVLAKRGSEAAETQAALAKLRILQQIVQTIPTELFEELEPLARDRLKGRDEEDWPYQTFRKAPGFSHGDIRKRVRQDSDHSVK
jgi:hypothetical protein